MNETAVILMAGAGLLLAIVVASNVAKPVGINPDVALTLALTIIRRWEGFRPVAYQDTGGKWAIGWGSSTLGGRKVTAGMVISPSQADQQLLNDARAAQAAVIANVVVPLTNNQLAALTSFVYNVGPQAFADSTMRRKLNQRDYDGAAAEFDRWVYDDRKKVVAGLENRRNDEQGVFTA